MEFLGFHVVGLLLWKGGNKENSQKHPRNFGSVSDFGWALFLPHLGEGLEMGTDLWKVAIS